MPRKNPKTTPRHIPFTHYINCKAKKAYPNETEAKKAAEIQMLLDMNLELSVYKCGLCNKWHLTRKK